MVHTSYQDRTALRKFLGGNSPTNYVSIYKRIYLPLDISTCKCIWILSKVCVCIFFIIDILHQLETNGNLFGLRYRIFFYSVRGSRFRLTLCPDMSFVSFLKYPIYITCWNQCLFLYYIRLKVYLTELAFPFILKDTQLTAFTIFPNEQQCCL